MKLSDEIIYFFQNQHFVLVNTLDEKGAMHAACKGIVEIDKNGTVYLLDLYQKNTLANLRRQHRITITAVDEHHFRGFSLKGEAKIIDKDELPERIFKLWEEKMMSRISSRVLKNIKGEKGHPQHPETLLPEPKYLIVMQVDEAIDLIPQHLK